MSGIISGIVRVASIGLLMLAGISAAGAQKAPPAQLSATDKSDMATVGKQLGATPYGELDLADPVHQRFFLRQLELGGFTPKAYPMLFTSIASARKLAVARRAQALRSNAATPAPGALASGRLAAPATTAALPIVPIVNITAFGQDGFSQAISATVQLSIPNSGNTAPPVALTSIGLYDQNNNPIGAVNGVSENYAGFDLQNTVIGVPGTPPSQVTLQGAYYYVDLNGAPHSGTIFAQAVLAGANQVISNQQPTDIDGNKVIKVCVVRADADCDYRYAATGGQYIVQFPIQGSVTFPVALQPIAQQQSSAVSITITQPNPTQGGGCTLPANFNFWNFATINGKVLTWLINPGPFSNPTAAPNNPCFPSNSTVIYNLFVTAYGTDNRPYMATITTAQIAPPPANTLVIYPMSVAYGCIAQGSKVALAGGGSTPIEMLVPGQELVAADGRTLKLRALTEGDEAIDMVRIRTANGHELVLTRTHPVLTPEGPIMAKALVAGQTVLTATGPSKLVGVTRVPGGKVWNLAFADSPGDQAFVANGVLVGDAAAQQHAELRERAILAERQQRAIPAAWRTDVESAKRHAREQVGGF